MAAMVRVAGLKSGKPVLIGDAAASGLIDPTELELRRLGAYIALPLSERGQPLAGIGCEYSEPHSSHGLSEARAGGDLYGRERSERSLARNSGLRAPALVEAPCREAKDSGEVTSDTVIVACRG